MIQLSNDAIDKYKNIIDYDSLSINKQLLNDVSLKEIFDRYLLLTYYKEFFPYETEKNIFYNRFLFYSKFMNQYIKKNGRDDLNLEQQRFKIIEEGEGIIDVDWHTVEEILNDIENEIL